MFESNKYIAANYWVGQAPLLNIGGHRPSCPPVPIPMFTDSYSGLRNCEYCCRYPFCAWAYTICIATACCVLFTKDMNPNWSICTFPVTQFSCYNFHKLCYEYLFNYFSITDLIECIALTLWLSNVSIHVMRVGT